MVSIPTKQGMLVCWDYDFTCCVRIWPAEHHLSANTQNPLAKLILWNTHSFDLNVFWLCRIRGAMWQMMEHGSPVYLVEKLLAEMRNHGLGTEGPLHEVFQSKLASLNASCILRCTLKLLRIWALCSRMQVIRVQDRIFIPTSTCHSCSWKCVVFVMWACYCIDSRTIWRIRYRLHSRPYVKFSKLIELNVPIVIVL